MESLMHIGNKIDKASRENLAKLIDNVLTSGFENHSGNDVIIKALDVCREVFEVKNVTVANSVFNGGGDKPGKKKSK